MGYTLVYKKQKLSWAAPIAVAEPEAISVPLEAVDAAAAHEEGECLWAKLQEQYRYFDAAGRYLGRRQTCVHVFGKSIEPNAPTLTI